MLISLRFQKEGLGAFSHIAEVVWRNGVYACKCYKHALEVLGAMHKMSHFPEAGMRNGASGPFKVEI